ncbi:MAG: hypothetical protein PWP48_1754 [Clostridiales bacterium]|jgi:excisionase family DNA binding protein|nr:hypothetical protein [Clostridiales bacterium]
MEKATYSVKEVAQILGVGQVLVYKEISIGNIPAVRLGKKRVVVPKWAIDELLGRQNGQTSGV